MSGYHHGNLREALLHRACEIIEADGVEALSLRALARDLKVSPSAPARHFKSRNDLLQTIAKTGYEQATHSTFNALARAGVNPMMRLNSMAKAYLIWTIENPALFAAISHPDVSRHANRDLQNALKLFVETIKITLSEAQKSGWRQDEDLDKLFHFTIALIRGLTINSSDQLYISVVGQIENKVNFDLIDTIFSSH